MNLQNKQSDQKCVICLNIASNQVNLDQCNHLFCFACINKWSEKSHQCPQCRAMFSCFYEIKNDSKIDIIRHEAPQIINNTQDKLIMALADIDNTYYDLMLQQIDFI
ncbi:unnamed protein product [Paramecium pentaurelia]|uniref:RING-type domain-containing protein n=1 Tax=Paramecium pentaurelia TaxID=43138 RepID=A0A8S1SIP0_9CILI|nr:unnamed protein product [Paramecium pentaurelia]